MMQKKRAVIFGMAFEILDGVFGIFDGIFDILDVFVGILFVVKLKWRAG